jgi:glycosyltransferase involved in cell wall biosynthesis
MSSHERVILKMAVCTQSISHFEVPMYRLGNALPGLEIRVFHLDPVEGAGRLDADYGQVIHWGVDTLAGYEAEQCASPGHMRARVRAWGADVVLMYGYSWAGAPTAILLRWLRGEPQIHRGTLNYHHDPRARLRSRFMRPLGRWLLSRFDAHHYGGSYSRKVLLDAGAKPESLFFVPYSVDSEFFSQAADVPAELEAARDVRNRAGWGVDDRVLLFIAQHNWVKGPDIVMEVFRQYQELDGTARLLVVGSGSESDEMKTHAVRHGLKEHVHFTGFVPSHGTVPYYLASDMVLCTSRYETWARMVNEAMLCRKPCVINHIVPAAGGLVDDGMNGFVVQGLEPELYVEAISRYFAMGKEQQLRMGESARVAAQRFSYEANIEGVLDAARYAVGATGK